MKSNIKFSLKDFTVPFLIALVALVSLIAPAISYGANFTFTMASGGTTNVFTNGLTVSQVSIANATATPSTVVLFDSGTGQNTYSNNQYVTTSYATSTLTNLYTNYFGVLNSNVYTALVASSITNAAATNLYNIPLTIQVPTNTTIVLDGTYRFNRGVFATNGTAAVAVSLTYQQ